MATRLPPDASEISGSENLHRRDRSRAFPRHLQELRRGVRLDDGTTAPCEVEILDGTRSTVIALRLREGRNRQVRRMFEALGYDMRKLERVEYAGLNATV